MGKMTWAYEQTFGRFGLFYAKLLRWSLRRRMDVLVISLLAMASMAIPANPETGVKPAGDQNMGGRQVSISYTMPQDVTLDEADVFFKGLEAWFADNRAEWNIDG